MKDLMKNLIFWIDHPKDVMVKNAKFLAENFRDLVDSCIDILNDVIDAIMWLPPDERMPKDRRERILLEYLMYPVLFHVAYPNLNILPTLVFLGALPQAFYTMRTVLEAFVIALYADGKKELKGLSWLEKIEDKSVRNATVLGVKHSLQKILVDAFSDEGKKWIDYLCELYSNISAWIHPVARIRVKEKGEREVAAGIVRAVALFMEKHEVPPAYGLVIPMEYTTDDIEDLKYLEHAISCTRITMAVIFYAWSADKEWVNKETIKAQLEKLINVHGT